MKRLMNQNQNVWNQWIFLLGRENIVDLLIENGANVSASSQDGWTPLHNAANNGHLSILKKLIEKGADVNVKKDDGYIALHNAAQKGT